MEGYGGGEYPDAADYENDICDDPCFSEESESTDEDEHDSHRDPTDHLLRGWLHSHRLSRLQHADREYCDTQHPKSGSDAQQLTFNV